MPKSSWLKALYESWAVSSLLEKNHSGLQSAVAFSLCWRTTPTCVGEALVARESLAVSEGKAGQTDCMRVTLMLLKASRITGNHSSLSKPFLPPLRAAVRDSRIFAAAGMNQW